MNRQQQILVIGCSALAGLTGSIVVALWAGEVDLEISIYALQELLYSLRTIGPIGFLVGIAMGVSMVVRKQKRIWQIRIWVYRGIRWAFLVMTPWLLLTLGWWLAARAGVSSAGKPSEALQYLLVVLLVGTLAGIVGGFVGGFIFTRVAGKELIL